MNFSSKAQCFRDERSMVTKSNPQVRGENSITLHSCTLAVGALKYEIFRATPSI